MRKAAPLVASLILLSAGPAAAQTADDLFREGMQLMQRGEAKVACEKFAQSYKLDAAPGTLYNLAACHERTGRLWLAHQEFLDLVERAAAVGKPDKAQQARDRAAEIEVHLPKLQLDFPPDSKVTDVLVDGTSIPKRDWPHPIPVDFGSHVVEFRGPVKLSTKEAASTPHEGEVVRVQVPVLADVTTTKEQVAPSPPASPTRSEGSVHSGGGGGRALGFVLGGVGLAGLAVGGLFGLRALSAKSDADNACGGQGRICPDAAHAANAQSNLDSARTDAWVSTIGIGVGVVALGAGVYFLARPAPASPATGQVHVLTQVGQGSGGIAVQGTF